MTLDRYNIELTAKINSLQKDDKYFELATTNFANDFAKQTYHLIRGYYRNFFADSKNEPGWFFGFTYKEDWKLRAKECRDIELLLRKIVNNGSSFIELENELVWIRQNAPIITSSYWGGRQYEFQQEIARILNESSENSRLKNEVRDLRDTINQSEHLRTANSERQIAEILRAEVLNINESTVQKITSIVSLMHHNHNLEIQKCNANTAKYDKEILKCKHKIQEQDKVINDLRSVIDSLRENSENLQKTINDLTNTIHGEFQEATENATSP
jgi:hypothetical protein